MGSADRGKCDQHLLAVDRKFNGAGLVAGYMAQRFLIAVIEPGQGILVQNLGLVRMSGDNSVLVDHISCSVSSDVDTADHVVECIVLIYTYDIERSLPVFLHRHPHGDTKLPLVNGRGIGSHIVGLLKKIKKTALQRLRCVVNSQKQTAVQTIKADGMKFIDFCGLRQDLLAVRL